MQHRSSSFRFVEKISRALGSRKLRRHMVLFIVMSTMIAAEAPPYIIGKVEAQQVLTGNFAQETAETKYGKTWIASITCRAQNGSVATIGGTGNPVTVQNAVNNAILQKGLPYSQVTVPLVRSDGGTGGGNKWNDNGTPHLPTLRAACVILGYADYVSSTCLDSERSGTYPRGKCNFHSPHDNRLSRFTGSIAPAQCADGIDNDGDGKIDMVDPGCSGSTDNDETNTPPPTDGTWVPTWGGSCTSVCAAQGMVSAANKNGSVCASGEDNVGEAVRQLGTSIFRAGCWNHSCSEWLLDYQTINVGKYCYYPWQKQDHDSTDITAACHCKPTTPPQCSDGLDNDGDGATDMNDFSCSGPTDNDETNPKAQCQDGIDNDGDGKTDYPQDPGCTSKQDNDEFNPVTPQCSDGLDNDGDGAIDMNDFSCTTPTDTDETNPKAQCQDGIDNDGDGKTDYPQDPGCTSKQDNDEFNPVTPQCSDGLDNDGDGKTDMQDPGCSSPTDPNEGDESQCQDGIDNDGDGAIDMNDFSCSGPTDNDETNPKAQCQDGIDNDGDGKTDYPQDPGCTSKQDNDEFNPVTPQCQDGIDNDGDGAIDYPNDFSCTTPTDTDETNPKAQCQDGVDNDSDGKTDYPQDPGCASKQDNNEYNPVSSSSSSSSMPIAQCSDGIDNDGDGATDLSDFSCSGPTDNDETNPKAQCQDGIDNDGDGKTDYPQDPGCTSKQDNDEWNASSSSSSSMPTMGCIEVLKETFYAHGSQLWPVPQFTFKLNNNRTVLNDAEGYARFDDVPAGMHTVTEIVPQGWELFLITPEGGQVQVNAGSHCAGLTFKNRQNVLGSSSSSRSSSSSSSVGQCANLIRNPSLETDGGNGQPQYWNKNAWGTNSADFTYPADGHSGDRGVAINMNQCTTGDGKWYFDDVAVTSGTTYTFTDWYKSTSESILTARYTMQNGSLSYAYIAPLPQSDVWRKASVQITPPANTVTMTVFHLLNTAGTLTVDDFSLSTCDVVSSSSSSRNSSSSSSVIISSSSSSAAGGNLISNPSFETAGANGDPASWYRGNWGTNTVQFAYPAQAHDGSKGAALTASQYTDGDAKWYFEDVQAVAGRQYSFSNWYKSTTSTSYVIRYTMQDGSVQYFWLGNAPVSADWTKFNATFTAPVNVKQLTIFHALSAMGTLTVDHYDLR